MKTYTIDSPLLLQAILGNMFCDKVPLVECEGFLQNSQRGQIGRAFLEYCYSELFGIRRFPGYEVLPMNNANTCKCLVDNAEINDEDIDYACTQLRELYQYTQKRLREEKGETYRIHRKLASFEIESLGEQIVQGQKDLSVQSNILSCYCHSSAYTDGGVVLVRDVNIKDIVMVDYMTSYVKKSNCAKIVSFEDGEGEVWVLNKNRFGKLYVRKEWIVGIDKILHRQKNHYQAYVSPLHIRVRSGLTEDDGKSILESHTVPERPCELDDPITKWVMKRNEKRIRKKYR